VEVLSFLIDCIAQRRLEGDGGNSSGMNGGMGPDDEYAMFGLAMVHRAILAGGPALQLHEALLGLLHRELFAAMTAAVGASTACVAAAPMCCTLLVVLCYVPVCVLILQHPSNMISDVLPQSAVLCLKRCRLGWRC
jgi:hypothetical protein